MFDFLAVDNCEVYGELILTTTKTASIAVSIEKVWISIGNQEEQEFADSFYF
jgi:hypothetical protein